MRFKRLRRSMNARLFIICDTEEDFKKFWLWCYEHNYTENSNLTGALHEFNKYNTDEMYIKPPMYCIDPETKKMTYRKRYSLPMSENAPSDIIKLDDEDLRAYEFQRKHALHAKDIDFDFLNPID